MTFSFQKPFVDEHTKYQEIYSRFENGFVSTFINTIGIVDFFFSAVGLK